MQDCAIEQNEIATAPARPLRTAAALPLKPGETTSPAPPKILRPRTTTADRIQRVPEFEERASTRREPGPRREHRTSPALPRRCKTAQRGDPARPVFHQRLR